MANKPIHRPGYHLLGRRNPLPEGWAEDYHRALQALSRTNTSTPHGRDQASELEGYLDRLEGQAQKAGRGGVYRPKPSVAGFYPDTSRLPLDSIKTAVRANTPPRTRHIAWEEVSKAAQPVYPAEGESVRMKRHNGLDALQRRHFMEAVAVSLPIAKGREPHFLGEKVPGELTLGPTGTASIIGGTNMSSSDWSRGFTAMKFSIPERAAKLGEWALNHKKTVGAIAAASTVGPSLLTTPGYSSGYRKGKAGERLTDGQVIRNRLIPGYTDGYERGRKRLKEGYALEYMRVMPGLSTQLKKVPDWVRSANGLKVRKLRGRLKLTEDAYMGMVGNAEILRKEVEFVHKSNLEHLGNMRKANHEARTAQNDAISALKSGLEASEKHGKKATLRAGAIGLGSGLVGGFVGGRVSKRNKKDYTKQETRAYYELGFQYGIRDFWNSFTDKIHGNVGPTLLRGAYIHGLGKLHQEIGLPPTTVDGIPVQRRSLNSTYGPYSTNELLMARSGLQKHVEADQGDAEVTQKAIEDLTREIVLRRNLSSV